MSSILSILQTVTEHPEIKLCLQSNGELGIEQGSWYTSIQTFFGAHKFASSSIASFLESHKSELITEIEQAGLSYKQLTELQKTIDQTFASAGIKKQTMDVTGLSHWMEKLPIHMKTIPLSQLLLPGSHDSAAYKVDFSHPIPHADNHYFNPIHIGSNLSSWIFPVGNIVKNFTITQTETISEQLNHGIRVFDIRVAYDTVEKDFYVTHTFTIDTLENIAQQFKQFMEEHPTEAVIINIKPDYEHRMTMGPQQGDALLQYLEHKFDGLLVDRSERHTVNLQTIADHHTPGLIFFEGNRGSYKSSKIWNGAQDASHFWPNQTSIDGTLNRVTQYLSGAHPAERFNFTGFHTTPTPEYIKSHLLSSVVRDGHHINDHLEQFMLDNFHKLGNISGFTADAVNADYAATIIDMNLTLMPDHSGMTVLS